MEECQNFLKMQSKRLNVEKKSLKLAYQKLPTEELKEAFLNTHTTKAKFEFCENHNVFIPPVYYVLPQPGGEFGLLRYITNIFPKKNHKTSALFQAHHLFRETILQ